MAEMDGNILQILPIKYCPDYIDTLLSVIVVSKVYWLFPPLKYCRKLRKLCLPARTHACLQGHMAGGDHVLTETIISHCLLLQPEIACAGHSSNGLVRGAMNAWPLSVLCIWFLGDLLKELSHHTIIIESNLFHISL